MIWYYIVVFPLDGKLDIGAHVWSDLGYLICSRHLIRSRAVTNRNFFSPERPIFLYACATCSELSDICAIGYSSTTSTFYAQVRIFVAYRYMRRRTGMFPTAYCRPLGSKENVNYKHKIEEKNNLATNLEKNV